MKKITLLFLCLLPLVSINAANVSGKITSNTHWTLANSPYIVTANVEIQAGITLQIQAGVEVLFNANTALVNKGTLTANAVVFSSNTTQSPGAWDALYIDAGSTTTLEGVSIQYADAPIKIRGVAQFNLVGENAFANNKTQAIALQFTNIDNGGVFHLPKAPVPYLTSSIGVQNNSTLSLAPGCILKMPSRGYISINQNSYIKAIGTENDPIIITSYRDTEVGGYTEAGGATPNFWRGIHVHTLVESESILEYCIIKYAGNAYYETYDRPGVLLGVNAQLTLVNTRIEQADRALSLRNGAYVKLKNSTLNGLQYPVLMAADAQLEVENSTIDFTNTANHSILLYGGNTLQKEGHIKIIPFTNAPNMAYTHEDYVTVPEGLKLTIDPGVVLKGVNTSGRFEISGELQANGTTEKQIVFTSMSDDQYSMPEDSNANGVATSPALSQYGGIIFRPGASSASSLSYCTFKYAYYNHQTGFKGENSYPEGAVNILDTSPTIENCAFFEARAAITAYGESNFIAKNNSFENITLCPIVITPSVHPVLTNNTWGENIKYRAIGLKGLTTFSSTQIHKINEGGYENINYFLLGHWFIPAGINVGIDPGIVIKVGDNVQIQVRGGLKIEGTEEEPVVFTESRDDNYGTPADLESDGNASLPSVARWCGIAYYYGCDTEFSSINHAIFRYGGANGFRSSYTYTSGVNPLSNANELHNTNRSAVLTFSRVSVDIQNCKIFSCYHGLAYYGPEAKGSASQVVIEKSEHAAIAKTISATPRFNQVKLENNWFQGIFLQESSITYQANLQKTAGIIGSNTDQNAVYVFYTFDVKEGCSLSVQAGIILKANHNYGSTIRGSMQVLGTANERVSFTSFHDDSKGGDNNNNGTATAPDKRNWAYYGPSFAFTNTSTNNQFKFVDIAYTTDALLTQDAPLLVEDCRIEQLSGYGIQMQGISSVTVRRTEFNNLSIPIVKHAFTTANLHEGNSVSNVSVFGIQLLGEILSTSGTLPLYTFAGQEKITYYTPEQITIDTQSTLTIPAGTSFKIPNLGCLFNVLGTLNMSGTNEQPVILTDVREDSYGSPKDFNQDGNTTAVYSRRNNTFIQFNANSGGNLQHAVLKSNGWGIGITNASPSLSHILFDNLGYGVSLTGIASAPSIENCVFTNVTYPVETSLLCFPSSLAGNTFTGSTYKGIKVSNEVLNQNATLSARPFGELENAPYIFDNYTVSAELTIENGVICKFLDGKKITVNRWLKALGTAEKPVVFTSIYDDYYGGDTNADQTASAATGSHWNGISFEDASIDGECLLQYAVVKNAYEAITTTNASPSLDKLTFYQNRNAIHATGSSNPVVTNCDFVGHSQRAINNVNQSFVIQASNCWWGSTEGPVVAAGPSGTRQAVSESVAFTPYRATGLNQPILGDVSGNGSVQAYDASLVLQSAVGSISLEPQQALAAEVSGDGTITAYDATLILEYIAGIRSFVPRGLKSAQILPESSLQFLSADYSASEEVLVPMRINDLPTSAGIDVIICFNPLHLQALEVIPSTQANFVQALRIDNENGKIYLAAASTHCRETEVWNTLRFKRVHTQTEDVQTSIEVGLVRVNEIDRTAGSNQADIYLRVSTQITDAALESTFYCYPNPTSDRLYFPISLGINRVIIYNESGQVIDNQVPVGNSINCSHLSPGIYYVQAVTNQSVLRSKFLKK